MNTTLSTHVLNGTDGTHADGVGITLFRIAPTSPPEKIFEDKTNEGGRLVREVDLAQYSPNDQFELVFAVGTYWQSFSSVQGSIQVLEEIVVRFKVPDKSARYHFPIISSPNSYSMWWTGLEGNL